MLRKKNVIIRDASLIWWIIVFCQAHICGSPSMSNVLYNLIVSSDQLAHYLCWILVFEPIYRPFQIF